MEGGYYVLTGIYPEMAVENGQYILRKNDKELYDLLHPVYVHENEVKCILIKRNIRNISFEKLNQIHRENSGLSMENVLLDMFQVKQLPDTQYLSVGYVQHLAPNHGKYYPMELDLGTTIYVPVKDQFGIWKPSEYIVKEILGTAVYCYMFMYKNVTVHVTQENFGRTWFTNLDACKIACENGGELK